MVVLLLLLLLLLLLTPLLLLLLAALPLGQGALLLGTSNRPRQVGKECFTTAYTNLFFIFSFPSA